MFICILYFAILVCIVFQKNGRKRNCDKLFIKLLLYSWRDADILLYFEIGTKWNYCLSFFRAVGILLVHLKCLLIQNKQFVGCCERHEKILIMKDSFHVRGFTSCL